MNQKEGGAAQVRQLRVSLSPHQRQTSACPDDAQDEDVTCGFLPLFEDGADDLKQRGCDEAGVHFHSASSPSLPLSFSPPPSFSLASIHPANIKASFLEKSGSKNQTCSVDEADLHIK